MTVEQQQTPAAGAEVEDDTASLVADVFGLDLGGDAGEAATPNEPSVGTEGAGAGEASADPAPASPQTPPADGGTGSAAPAQPAAPETGTQGQPAQTPPAAQPSDPQSLELQSVKSQLATALQAIDELRNAAGTQQQPNAAGQPGQPAQGGQQPTPPAPKVIPVQLPDQLVQAILGEGFEPQQKQGLDALVTHLATGLNYRFEQQLAALRTDMEGRLNGQQQQQQQQTEEQASKQAREDYFKHFPDHNKPVLLPIIQQEAVQLAAELPGVPFNEQFRNALGARVNAALQAAGFQVQPGSPAAPAPAATPAPRPAAMMPSGTRPTPEEDDNLIADTFSW